MKNFYTAATVVLIAGAIGAAVYLKRHGAFSKAPGAAPAPARNVSPYHGQVMPAPLPQDSTAAQVQAYTQGVLNLALAYQATQPDQSAIAPQSSAPADFRAPDFFTVF